MNPWFDNPGKILSLQLQADDWLGTPFFPNSQAKHRGVSCQKLAAALYRDVGFIDLDVPEVAMNHARFSATSLVQAYMQTRDDFALVEGAPIIPGDLLGFRIHRSIHHVGVALGDGRFVHCIDQVGVQITTLSDCTWGSRLAAVWRPIYS